MHEVVRPKTTTALAEIAITSQQHAALLRKAVFDTLPGTFSVRRGATDQTPMVDQLPPVADTPVVGSQKVWFREPTRQAINPNCGGGANSLQSRDVLCRGRAK